MDIKQGENIEVKEDIIINETDVITSEPAKTADPTAKTTEPATVKTETEAPDTEPAKEMTTEQFALYNETLRRVSKTAKPSLQTRYNAFEDAEVKAAVKQQVMDGETPDIKTISESVVAKLTAKPKPISDDKNTKTEPSNNNEVAELKAELALVKAGIRPERLDAAKKLFLAEGGDPAKISDFVKQYPEWQADKPAATGITFSKAPPVDGKTAPNSTTPPVMNDFEKRVYEARKARGLPT